MRYGFGAAVAAAAMVFAVGFGSAAWAHPDHGNRVFSGHSGFPRGFGYTNTVTPPGQGNLRAYSPCITTPKPRRCR